MKYKIYKFIHGDEDWESCETLCIVESEDLARSIVAWLEENDTDCPPGVYKHTFNYGPYVPYKSINNMDEFVQYFHEEIEM